MGTCYNWFLLTFILVISMSSHGQETNDEMLKARANELQQAGSDLYYEGLYYQALDTFNLLLDYREEIYDSPSYYLGTPYLLLGATYKNLGQHQLALENYNLAQQSYFQREDHRTANIAKLYVNIGNVHRAKLDYKSALSYFEQALSIFLLQKPIDLVDISDAYYSMAELHYLIGNHDIAIQILTEHIHKGDTYNQIYYNELIAIIFQNQKRNDLAIKHYEEMLRLAEIEYDDSDIELGTVIINYAEFLFSVAHFDACMKTLQRAFRIIHKVQPEKGEHLSRYYELRGGIIKDMPIKTQQINKFKSKKKSNLREAINWYIKGINALSSSNDIDIQSVRIEDCISFMDCLVLLQQIGSAYVELAALEKDNKILYKKSLTEAMNYYNAASQLTQQARRELSNDESKIQLAELEHYTFSQTIEIAYLAYQLEYDDKYLELAFYNAEQLKSSAVFDKISNDIAQENSLIPDSLLDYENKLNEIISIYNQKIFEENGYEDSDSTLIQEYKDKIFNASLDRDELNRLLEEEYPDYYELKYSNSMLSVKEIQKELAKNEAIFEYVIVEPDLEFIKNNKADTSSQLYTILITQNTTVFNKNPIDNISNASFEKVFGFMSNPAYLLTTNDDSKEFCTASHRLYNLLIDPYKNELVNKKLVIIPDGKLNYISFDGLISNLPDTSRIIDFTKLDYLINDFNIGYANSANILIKNRNNSKKPKNSTLAFAPEYKSEKFEMSGSSYTLMPLPGVQKEVEAIAESITTKIYRKEEASEQNFRENAKSYDILHLAMHAYINDSLPAFSRLAFSPKPNETDLNKDGWLNTTDIYNLELNARMTVLSACNTGIGKLRKGEGMMSLARGFLYAGCPSIVMSLWEVEDESGTQIMTSFYKNLKKGKSKDEALRLAKLNYIENSNSRLAHPHYWMSFKSIGDNSPIYTSYDVYFFSLLIVLILAFIIDQLLRIKKIKHKRKAI